MDVNELQVGSTLYFQVFQKGGLIWTGGFPLLAGERRSEPDRPGMFL
jgi:acetamidase/formamidase